MWRFMLLTFAMLGWAFYELSGGSDYAPREGMLQAVAREPGQDVARAVSPPAASVEIAQDGDGVVETAALGNDAFGVTLAAARDPAPEEASAPARAETPGAVAGASLFSDPVLPVTSAGPAAPAPLAAPPADMRRVAGAAVNMRNGPGTSYSVLARLSRGERVEVLSDPGEGWVKLRVETTGRVGWMAAALLEKTDA